MGRPRRITPESTERFRVAIRAGAFPEVAAKYAGFSPATYYRAMKGSTPADAAFREALAEEANALEIRLSSVIARRALTEPRWALELLERRFRPRWGRRAAGDEEPGEPSAGASDPTDELVAVDPALLDVVAERLLALSERRRSGAGRGAENLDAFEDRGPRGRAGAAR